MYKPYVYTTITYWRFRVKKIFGKIDSKKREVNGMAELIAFFSRADENYVNGMLKVLDVGNTEVLARILQELTGAELFKIEPFKAYSKDYNQCIAEASADQKRGARPELKAYPQSLAPYDVIYLGFPNYWGTMPMAVFTFLERFDFTGKTIRPFCTHEGSKMGTSIRDVKRLCPKAFVKEGLAVQGSRVERSKGDIEAWYKQGG